jgi:hypothetical protein
MDKPSGKTLLYWNRYALTFVILYVVVYTAFPLICQNLDSWPKAEPYYKFVSRAEIKDAMSAIFSVAVLIITIHYSGIFVDFHKKLTAFGITDVRAHRKGQDPALTPMWIERISNSPEVMIVGTKSRGWFIKAKDELDHFLNANGRNISRFDVYLLDPHGETWRSMLRSEQEFKVFIQEVAFVLDSLQELRTKHRLISLFFYDSEPLHCVVARREIYFAIALPFQDPASYPELTISQGSYLGNKIYEEAIKKLQGAASLVSEARLKNYCALLRKHMSKASNEYWKCPKPTD